MSSKFVSESNRENEFDEYLARSYNGGFVNLSPQKQTTQSRTLKENERKEISETGGKVKSGYSYLWKLAARNLRIRLNESGKVINSAAKIDDKSILNRVVDLRERCESKMLEDTEKKRGKRNPKLHRRAYSDPNSNLSRNKSTIPNSNSNINYFTTLSTSAKSATSYRSRQNTISTIGGSDLAASRREVLRTKFSKTRSLSVPDANRILKSPEKTASAVKKVEGQSSRWNSNKNAEISFSERGRLSIFGAQPNYQQKRRGSKFRSSSLTSMPEYKSSADIQKSDLLKRGSSLKGWSRSPRQNKVKQFLVGRSNSIPRRQNSMRKGKVVENKDKSRVTSVTDQIYQVWIVGSSGTGRSNLMFQFAKSKLVSGSQADGLESNSGSNQTLNDRNASEDEPISDIYNKDRREVSLIVSGEFSALRFLEVQIEKMKTDITLVRLHHTTNQPAAYIILYSVEDRYSFQQAIDCLYALRKGKYSVNSDTVIVLAANKIDLVRTRMVLEQEGRSAAKAYDSKYIEVSTAIDHNVDELLVGVLTLIRQAVPICKQTFLDIANDPQNQNISQGRFSGLSSRKDEYKVAFPVPKVKDRVITMLFGKDIANKKSSKKSSSHVIYR